MKYRNIFLVIALIILLAVTVTGCLVQPGSGSEDYYAELPIVTSTAKNTIDTSETSAISMNEIDDSIAVKLIGEKMIGQTVKLRGILTEVKRFDSGHASAKLTDSSGSMTVYFHRDSKVDLIMLITGQNYSVSGTVDRYKGEIQVLPQSNRDIQLVSEITFETAKVVKVVDGDTIHVQTADGEVETIRMIGVDTPELAKDGKQAEFFADQAHAFTEEMLMDKTVYLEQDHDDRDQYGRKLRYVWIKQPQIINEQMIRENLFSALLLNEGYASFVHFNDDRKYKELLIEIESEAQNGNLGIWG